MTQQLIFDFEGGNKLRDDGINRAIDNADNKEPDWREKAYWILAQLPPGKFMVERLREFAYSKGLPRPPSERAWGSVIKRAQKSGMVVFVKYDAVENPKAHRTPAAVWCKVK